MAFLQAGRRVQRCRGLTNPPIQVNRGKVLANGSVLVYPVARSKSVRANLKRTRTTSWISFLEELASTRLVHVLANLAIDAPPPLGYPRLSGGFCSLIAARAPASYAMQEATAKNWDGRLTSFPD